MAHFLVALQCIHICLMRGAVLVLFVLGFSAIQRLKLVHFAWQLFASGLSERSPLFCIPGSHRALEWTCQQVWCDSGRAQHHLPIRIIHYITQPYHVTTSQPTTAHHMTAHHITSHHFTLHYITLQYITLQYVTTLHYITLQYNTLHYITSHHITSHYITPQDSTMQPITSHCITLRITHQA